MSPLSDHSKTLRRILIEAVKERLRHNGYRWLLGRICIRILTELCWIALCPIAVLLHIAGYRRLMVRSEHIGHWTTEPDTFLKEERMGMLVTRRWFMAISRRKNSNEHLLGYWKSHIPIITEEWVCRLVDILTRRFFMRLDVSRYTATFFGTQDVYRINRLWGNRSPILQLTKDDKDWGDSALSELGIDRNQWFVCFHAREGGFLPNNETIQKHRNVDIEKMIPAMQTVVAAGGVCVRMGDSSMKPLPPIDGVIDYANHSHKSARLDVVLCAKARLFVGCTSGLCFLSAIFGVPVTHTNMIPVATLGITHRDLSIPKRIWSNNLQRYLHFSEILGSEIGDYFFTNQYVLARLRVDENDAADITAIVGESLERIAGDFCETEADEKLQQKYLSLLKPGHYSYGAASKISTLYLRKYQEFLKI